MMAPQSFPDQISEATTEHGRPIPIDSLEWEECSCAWCGSQQNDVLFRGPDYLHGLPGVFQMVQCKRCGLIRQNPRLQWESLQHYYPEGYEAYARLAQEETNMLIRWNRLYGSKKRLHAIHKHIPTGRLLDVGFGSGLFLEAAMQSKRWEVSGIEPTKNAYDYVSKRLSVTAMNGLFTQTDFGEDKYDLITMWNVMEHMPNPVEAIEKSYDLLTDGGWLVLSVPNPSSLAQRVFGQYWVGWDLPRHLYIFPMDILGKMLSDSGFRVVTTRNLSTSYAMLGHSLEFWSQSWQSKWPRLQKAFMRSYYSPLVRIGLLAPLWILDKLRLSTVTTVFAQKTNLENSMG